MNEEEYNYYPIDISKSQNKDEPSFNTPAVVPSASNIIPSPNGSIMGAGTLTSPNFSHNNSGWRIDSNGNVEFADGVFRGDITGASGTFSGTLSATTGNIGGFTLSSSALYAGTGATRIGLDTSSGIYLGATTFGASPFSVSLAGALNATSGTIGGWDMTSSLLRSATSGARVELNKGDNRISIFDATNEKVVMGYLNGLPKHDGTGNWGASNYGFWARTGDKLSIDGDGEFVNGDWIIQNDASYLVKDASLNTIIRLGTDTGEKGLFIYNTAGTQLAKFISDEINIGDSTSYLNYTTASGLKLYSNDTNALTFDYGSNTLYKEGGNINFSSVVKPTDCTATLIATGTGNIDNGTHSYKVTYITSTGETELGTVSNTVTVDASNKQVALSAIPISTSSSVTSRKIYRTKAGASFYFLLTTINNNTSTTYTDNIADSSLTGNYYNFKSNDTFGKIKINGIESLSLGENTFVGQYSGNSIISGAFNTGVGIHSLQYNTYGYYNSSLGYSSLFKNTTGSYNTAIGTNSSFYNTTGQYNTSIGISSLINNSTGSNNVCVGANAGKYETGSDAFYVDSRDRTNTAGDKEGAILYGVMSDTPTSQRLKINANITTNAINYAADAGATDAYAITLDPPLTAYVVGQQVIFKANTANTGTATLSVNGMTARTIYKGVSTTLADNDILAGMMCVVVFSFVGATPYWTLINPRTL